MTIRHTADGNVPPVGGICYGVRAGHLPRSDVRLYEIGLPDGRRAFLCDGCRDSLTSIGMRVKAIEPAERQPERRVTWTRRRGDGRLGSLGYDRRVT